MNSFAIEIWQQWKQYHSLSIYCYHYRTLVEAESHLFGDLIIIVTQKT